MSLPGWVMWSFCKCLGSCFCMHSSSMPVQPSSHRIVTEEKKDRKIVMKINFPWYSIQSTHNDSKPIYAEFTCIMDKLFRKDKSKI
jgi:hypothetical protein